MNFYEKWEATRKDNVDDFEFFKNFLNKTINSTQPLISGSEDEVIFIIKMLLGISIDEFIENLCKCDLCHVEPGDIIQFSKFERAFSQLPAVLLYEDNALDFNEIGKKIMGSKSEGARIKYGENHSKLACEMGFVEIFRDGKVLVRLATLGKVAVSLSEKDKYDLALKMLVRNSFIRNIIKVGKENCVFYEKLTENLLSKSTSLRRKNNVKQVVEAILETSNFIYIKNNIFW